jgi:hypothetical protein
MMRISSVVSNLLENSFATISWVAEDEKIAVGGLLSLPINSLIMGRISTVEYHVLSVTRKMIIISHHIDLGMRRCRFLSVVAASRGGDGDVIVSKVA